MTKKLHLEQAEQMRLDVEAVKRRALSALESQIAASVNGDLDDRDLDRLTSLQSAVRRQQAAIAAHDQQRTRGRVLQLVGGIFADDWDSRVS